jgi:hypothetical protein
MKKIALAVVVCLALAVASGCAGIQDNQDFDTWRDVERERALAWKVVMQALAQNPRTHKLNLRPIDPSKPMNAELVAELAVLEPLGTWEQPGTTDRPKSMGELVVEAARVLGSDFVFGILGYKSIESGERVLTKALDKSGGNITIGGNQVGEDYNAGTQVGGDSVGGDKIGRDRQDNDTTTTETNTETAGP